jgi:hypothetical protein
MFVVPSFFGFQDAGKIDLDYLAFYARVLAAGGSLTTTEQTATQQLVVDLKGYSIWTKMKAIYPMVGASAAACAQNLKSSTFTGTFTSGWTFASTGVTPNGTSAYMDTTLIPSLSLSQNSTHISVYSRTNNTLFEIEMGSISGGLQLYAMYYYSPNRFHAVNNSGFPTPNLSNTISLLIENRRSPVQIQTYKSGILEVTNSVNSNPGPNLPIYVGASNFNSSLLSPSTKEISFASIGDGLTDTEASNFYTAVQAFQTTLSRQV